MVSNLDDFQIFGQNYMTILKLDMSTWFVNDPLNIDFLHSRQEKLKKSSPKNSCNQICKSISRNFFWPNTIFCNFKNGQKSIFELGKTSQTAKKCNFTKNCFWFIWFHEFFFGLYLFKFSGPRTVNLCMAFADSKRQTANPWQQICWQQIIDSKWQQINTYIFVIFFEIFQFGLVFSPK